MSFAFFVQYLGMRCTAYENPDGEYSARASTENLRAAVKQAQARVAAHLEQMRLAR